MYDLIIIGGGPAGMTAALYAARANIKVAIVEGKLYGGQMLNTDCIENYPSYESISGEDLAEKMEEQMFNYKVDEIFGFVKEVKNHDDYNEIILDNNKSYKTKTVLIATGTNPKSLNIPGEDTLQGKGVSYCALCDANFFENKDIIVVGGGDSALEESIYLANYAKDVTIVHRRDEFRAQSYLQDKVKTIDNIHFILNDELKSINGSDDVSTVTLKSNKIIPTAGVFIYVGQLPQTQFVENLNITNSEGWITVNKDFQTKIPSIFAIGDCIDKEVRQIATAVGDGAYAAQRIYQYLLKS